MPNYIRSRQAGGTFFFTVKTHDRRAFLTTPEARGCLRMASLETCARYPFEEVAVCLLPDHLHTLWRLPENDSDYTTRLRFLKARFSWRFHRAGGAEGDISTSRATRNERGFWQRRFWEHTIQDEEDLRKHLDYIHYNPVKHEYVDWPEQWPWSSFHRYVRKGWYVLEWGHAPVPDIAGYE